MKKLFSALLCAALMIGLMAPAASAAVPDYAGDAVTNVTLTPMREVDKAFAQTAKSSDAGVLTALTNMMNATGEATAKPAGAEDLAAVDVEAAGATTGYVFGRGGGSYYLRKGTSYYPLEYAPFEAMAKLTAFYKFYKLPTAGINSNSVAVPLATTGQKYSYKSLNGTFYSRVAPADTVLPTVPLGTALKKLSYSIKPDSVTYTVYKGTGQAWSGGESEIASFKPEAKTEYRVVVKAKFNDTGYYRGTVDYSYLIGGSVAPAAGAATASAGTWSVTAEGSDTYPGEIVVLKVTGAPQGQTATAASSVEFTPKFFRKDADTQIALLPVSVYVATGKHWVDVSCAGETTRLNFNSKEKTFEVQHLTVEASTAEQTILSQKANTEYEQAIAPIRPIADDKQYWSGRFIMPVSDKKVTTSFGLIRYTNGSTTPGRHNALDLAVPRGTNVAASGGGRVIYSGFLQLTGNTIVIEHGYGLKSWHYHMDTRSVSTGDMVDQGDIIGTVGSTGFSTGPHLHFSMSVNGVFVNPYTLIDTDLLNQ